MRQKRRSRLKSQLGRLTLDAPREERRRSSRSRVIPTKHQRHCPGCKAGITSADLERGRCTQCDTNLTLWDIWQELRDRFKGRRRKR